MFSYNKATLKRLADDLQTAIKAAFPDKDSTSFSKPAVLATCIKSEFELEGVLEHFYAPKWANVIPAMERLHSALVLAGKNENDSYEIGAGDRYVAYLSDDSIKAKVLLFENQNVTYVVVIKPSTTYDHETSASIPAFTMHVRIVTPNRYSFDAKLIGVDRLDQKMLKGCDSRKYDDKSSDYFRYHDLRDRGYIVTVAPELITNDEGEVFYKIERPFSAHPMWQYILRELEGFASMMDETVKELLP